MQLRTYPRTSLEASSGRSHHIKRGQHDQTVLGRAVKQHLLLGLLLTSIGILLTTTATAQPRRNNRNGNSGNRLKAMMERLDTNRDGVITRSEFKGSPERFSMMDSNGDGKVDGAEMKAMCSVENQR